MKIQRAYASLTCLAAVLLLATPASAALVDTVNFTEQNGVVFVSGGAVTGIAWAPDGSNRLFITQKDGRVRIMQNGAVIGTNFALETVYTNSECGLLGVAFDHNFATNQYVYLFLTRTATEQQIVRYTASGNVGTNRTVLVAGLPTVGQNHDGGAVGIGPDNKLYWAIGDQGNGTGVDNDLTSLAAKVGRANLDGSIPNDNPFFDGNGPNNDHIWARGFRNPFTFTFHPITGQLWVNVVGTSYEQVMIVGRGGHGGWNDFENTAPITGAYIQPTIKYRTGSAQTFTIAASLGAVRTGNVVRFTTGSNHRMRLGEKVIVTGVSDNSFNGSFFINGVPADHNNGNWFTVAQNGLDGSSGNGTVTTLNMGNCITGGVFYDATAYPTAYRGNFFFGDFGANYVFRATLDPAHTVATSVDYWSTGIGTFIDADIGPDGNLWYASHNGTIHRVTYNNPPGGIVVNKQHVTMLEGGTSIFSVRLATAPAGSATLTIARTGGDADISVMSPVTLTFTAADFATPQHVTLAAAEDTDTTDDTATFTLTSGNLPAVTVDVRAIDNDTSQSLIVSQTALTINEGGTGMFTVALGSPPSGTVTVNVARTAGDSDVTVSAGATLTFDASNYATPRPVTIAAAEDADTTDDTATITVSTPNATSRAVAITARDNDSSPPVITSAPVLTGVVGAPYTYDVNATGLPVPTYSLTGMPAGMTINATTGVISWTPTATGMFSVAVLASNGVVPGATQSYMINVTADMAPTCVLTAPKQSAILRGSTEEFYGDGFDDVGTVRAEFSVDSGLRYTDTNSSGHYHYNGTHVLFDTTAFPDGQHTLRMTVFDTSGKSCFAEVLVTIANAAGDMTSPPMPVDMTVGPPPPDLLGADLAGLDLTAPPPPDLLGADLAGLDLTSASSDDGGATGTPRSGCGCAVGSAPTSDQVPAALGLLGLLVVVARRRRRAAS